MYSTPRKLGALTAAFCVLLLTAGGLAAQSEPAATTSASQATEGKNEENDRTKAHAPGLRSAPVPTGSAPTGSEQPVEGVASDRGQQVGGTAADQRSEQAAQRSTDGVSRATAAGSRVFIAPETGEFTNEPAAGQLERLLVLGRRLAQQREASQGALTPTAEEVRSHTSPVFTTPVGLGAQLDDRFLHSLEVRIGPAGELIYSCSEQDHDHRGLSRQRGNTRSKKPTAQPVEQQ